MPATDGGNDGTTDSSVAIDAAPPTSDCTSHGGTLCTSHHWVQCPSGFEPVSPLGAWGCGDNGDQGWCCQPAPASACSSGGGNCLTSCAACWTSKPNLACEQGRSCCEYTCD